MAKQNKSEPPPLGNGWMLPPVFPQERLDRHELLETQERADEKLLEELLTKLYYDHSRWLNEVKIVCESSGKPLEQYLRKALGLAIESGRVRDCNNNTALRLRGPERTGPDILLFFVKKCPHVRDALLRGELPPYPWRISQPIEQDQKPAETKKKEIVEVKPGMFGITVNIKELARRFWKWVCSHSKE